MYYPGEVFRQAFLKLHTMFIILTYEARAGNEHDRAGFGWGVARINRRAGCLRSGLELVPKARFYTGIVSPAAPAHPLGGRRPRPRSGGGGSAAPAPTSAKRGPASPPARTWVFFPEGRPVVHHETKIGGERPLRALNRAGPPRQAALHHRATGPAQNGSVEEGPGAPLSQPRSRPAAEEPPPARGRDQAQAQARGPAQQGRCRRHAGPPRMRASARHPGTAA